MTPACSVDPFSASRERLEEVASWLEGDETSLLSHAELEEALDIRGRALIRQLFQDHLDLRAEREARCREVTDAHGVTHASVEADHERALETIFGEVTVTRLAYRHPGEANLHPADAALNLPEERHSHGLRRLAAIESSRDSFGEASDSIVRHTGTRLGKRQVETLAGRAAVDFDAFYEDRKPPSAETGDVVVLTCDGKGVVMRPDALRDATARAAERASPKLKTRLSRGEKRGRKRMAELGSVYDATPVRRALADIFPLPEEKERKAVEGPSAKNKWLVASVVDDAAAVIGQVFDEAERRDPTHLRQWVALVDGARYQIEVIESEAKARGIEVPIVVDLVHVVEYLWKAAWCFFAEGDPAAEAWVQDKARAVLDGEATRVAGAIRRTATNRRLAKTARKGADECASYLTNKARYLDYPRALANGWPIATGVIEGACRHIVADRLDRTGARWGLAGAEAILKLRALRSNNDFDQYWKFHLAQERQRVHKSRYDDGVIPEAA